VGGVGGGGGGQAGFLVDKGVRGASLGGRLAKKKKGGGRSFRGRIVLLLRDEWKRTQKALRMYTLGEDGKLMPEDFPLPASGADYENHKSKRINQDLNRDDPHDRGKSLPSSTTK